MGDKIAQLIFEKIKTPDIVQTDSLEESERGEKGFGSIGLNSIKQKIVSQSSDQKPGSDQLSKPKTDQISSVFQSSNSFQNSKRTKQLKMNQSHMQLHGPKHRRRSKRLLPVKCRN